MKQTMESDLKNSLQIIVTDSSVESFEPLVSTDDVNIMTLLMNDLLRLIKNESGGTTVNLGSTSYFDKGVASETLPKLSNSIKVNIIL